MALLGSSTQYDVHLGLPALFIAFGAYRSLCWVILLQFGVFRFLLCIDVLYFSCFCVHCICVLRLLPLSGIIKNNNSASAALQRCLVI